MACMATATSIDTLYTTTAVVVAAAVCMAWPVIIARSVAYGSAVLLLLPRQVQLRYIPAKGRSGTLHSSHAASIGVCCNVSLPISFSLAAASAGKAIPYRHSQMVSL